MNAKELASRTPWRAIASIAVPAISIGTVSLLVRGRQGWWVWASAAAIVTIFGAWVVRRWSDQGGGPRWRLAVPVVAVLGVAWLGVDAYDPLARLRALEVRGRAQSGASVDAFGDRLDVLESHARLADEVEEASTQVPVVVQWLGVADDTQESLHGLRRDAAERLFVQPCMAALEEQLRREPTEYAETLVVLKQYLAFRQPTSAGMSWTTASYAALWLEVAGGTPSEAPRAEAFVGRYFELVSRDQLPRVELNTAAIERARNRLTSFPPEQQWDGVLVEQLADQYRKGSVGSARVSTPIPPVRWSDIVGGHPSAARFFVLQDGAMSGDVLVSGLHSGRALGIVVNRVRSDCALAHAWVVPLPTGDPDSVEYRDAMRGVVTRHAGNAFAAWSALMSRIGVVKPVSVADAVALYRLLETTASPIHRLLMLASSRPPAESDAFDTCSPDGIVMNAHLVAMAKRFDEPVRTNTLHSFFDGSSSDDATRYRKLMTRMRERAELVLASDASATTQQLATDASEAVREVDVMLKSYRDAAREVLRPMLVAPLELPRVAPH